MAIMIFTIVRHFTPISARALARSCEEASNNTIPVGLVLMKLCLLQKITAQGRRYPVQNML